MTPLLTSPLICISSCSFMPQYSSMILMQAYQLFKARAYGADAVLLIAAVLPNNDLDYLAAAARKLGLQCLIEVRPM